MNKNPSKGMKKKEINNIFLWMIDYGNSFSSSLLLLFTGLIIKFINGWFSEFIKKKFV